MRLTSAMSSRKITRVFWGSTPVRGMVDTVRRGCISGLNGTPHWLVDTVPKL